jgi:hypothetical protein
MAAAGRVESTGSSDGIGAADLGSKRHGIHPRQGRSPLPVSWPQSGIRAEARPRLRHNVTSGTGQEPIAR